VQLRVERRLIRCRNPCELFDFPGPCFFIEPFWIALFYDFERCIDEDFDEVETGRLVDFPSKSAIGAVGRDERRQRDTRGVREQARDLADPADVLVAGLLVEPEIFVQAEADVVPVQSVRESVQMEQVLLESAGDCGLCV